MRHTGFLPGGGLGRSLPRRAGLFEGSPTVGMIWFAVNDSNGDSATVTWSPEYGFIMAGSGHLKEMIEYGEIETPAPEQAVPAAPTPRRLKAVQDVALPETDDRDLSEIPCLICGCPGYHADFECPHSCGHYAATP